jgi:hypothetical protein
LEKSIRSLFEVVSNESMAPRNDDACLAESRRDRRGNIFVPSREDAWARLDDPAAECVVSNGSNERNLVSDRFVLRFAPVEVRQEILQVAYFFDAVLEPRLAFSVGK